MKGKAWGLAAVGLVGCAMAGGGAQAVLKAPVTSRCEKFGLDGCPDLVDGAIAYAEGDPQAGESALMRGVAANLDKAADLAEFAAALELIGKVPGAGQYVQPLRPAITIIKEAAENAAAESATAASGASAAASAAALAPGQDGEDPERGAVTASSADSASATAKKTEDDSKLASNFLLTGMLGSECPAGYPDKTVCSTKGFVGRQVVVHVLVSPACPGDVIISSGPPRKEPRWLLWVSAGKGLDLRDVELPLAHYDAITVGVVGVTALPDVRCGANVLTR